jgi:hypothetical protein
LKQQKYLEKIMKKLARVGLEAWVPAPRVWAAAPHAAPPHRHLLLLNSSTFFYQKNLFMRSLDLILS